MSSYSLFAVLWMWLTRAQTRQDATTQLKELMQGNNHTDGKWYVFPVFTGVQTGVHTHAA